MMSFEIVCKRSLIYQLGHCTKYLCRRSNKGDYHINLIGFFVIFSHEYKNDSNRDILKYVRGELYQNQKDKRFFNNNHKNEKEFLKIYENFLEISKVLQEFFENEKIKKLFENRKTKELEGLFKELKRHETIFTTKQETI